MAKAKIFLKPIFLLIFALALISVCPKTASADNLKWSRVNIPSNGISGKWVLAEGSDVRCPALTSDGTLYCYANPAATPYRLFKSTDSGHTWSYTGRVTDAIIDIAIIPGNPQGIYYATASGVYRYVDEDNFMLVANSPGGAGAGNKEITSLDVASVNGNEIIIVGTRDTDASQYGGVYILDKSLSPDWVNANVGNYDVYAVALSPNFTSDRQIVAVATDEHDTVTTTNIGNTSWNSSVGDARLAGLVPVSSAIAFPADYNSNLDLGKYTQFIALNTGSGNGDVYCIEGLAAPSASKVTDLNAGSADGLGNLDIASLAVSGNAGTANLMAGAAATAKTYFSQDAGKHWQSNSKPPTGDSSAYILMAPDFPTSGIAYTATSGSESAFSVSRDRGVTWNQTGLIDTRIMSILDLAVSPDYSQDTRLFLLTANVQDSLWYSTNGGLGWERIYGSTQAGSDRIKQVLLSSQYSGNKKVLLAGTSNGSPVIWKSEDNGRTFSKNASVDPVTQAPVNIDAWAIALGDVLFIGSYDGNNGLVYQTAGNGLSYIDKAAVGHQPLNSLKISPDYTHDKTILAGNTYGSVFYSHNNGLIFEPLPPDIAEAPLSGAVTLAFDSNYNQNKTVYAASDAPDKGLYRFDIDNSLAWEPIDGSLPAGAKIGQVVTSAGGLLCAVNLQNVDTVHTKGGMERSLDPCRSTGPSFETITSGLDDGVVLKKLWIQGNNLWTVDTTNNKLLAYTDTMAFPVTITSPANNTSNLDAHNTAISWEAPGGATGYHWQVDMDNSFSSTPKAFEGDTGLTSVKLTSLSSDTVYYWRVRAFSPITSPWSETFSFNTNTVPVIAVPKPTEPKGTTSASIQPVFKWNVSDGAEYYELQVSRFNDFSALIFDKTCNSNIWKCESALAYINSYYWRVRAVSGSNMSLWSEVNIFTTESAPTPTPSPSPSPLQTGNSAGSSNSGSGGLSDSTATPTPKSTPTPPARVIETSPSPTLSATSSPSIEPRSYTATATTTRPAPAATPAQVTPPSASPSASITPSATSGPADSTLRLIFFLIGSLVVLTGILIVVVIYMMKKFKRY